MTEVTVYNYESLRRVLLKYRGSRKTASRLRRLEKSYLLGMKERRRDAHRARALVANAIESIQTFFPLVTVLAPEIIGARTIHVRLEQRVQGPTPETAELFTLKYLFNVNTVLDSKADFVFVVNNLFKKLTRAVGIFVADKIVPAKEDPFSGDGSVEAFRIRFPQDPPT